MNNTPKMTRKYKYAKVRYEIELENISYAHNESRKKYKNIQLSLTISIISIFMSIVLMTGTTFAWFNSTVSNSGNVIKAGNIDVELFAQKGEETINLTNTELPAFNVEYLSPDNKEIETTFTVKNIGTLPFKCFMCFNGFEGDTELASQINVSVKYPDSDNYVDRGVISDLVEDTSERCVFYIDKLDVLENKPVTVKLSLTDGIDVNNAEKNLTFNIRLIAKQISE